MGSCDRSKRRICTKEEKGLSVVKGRKGGDERVYQKTVVERIYLTIKIITDSTSILCRKKGWKEADGAGLLIFE